MDQNDLHRKGLLNAVQDLHMNLTGTLDTCNNGFSMYQIYSALVDKIENWEPSSDDTVLYDNTIKLLVMVVISDFEKYRGH